MQRLFRKIGKYIIYLSIFLLTVTLSIVGLAFALQDKIIQLFVNEANKNITAKIYAEKIDIDFIQTFPRFSIDFHKVKIVEAVPRSEKYFATAENVFFSFSIWDLWRRKYKIKNLYVKNASLNFHIFKNGNDNFTILKQSSEDTTKHKSIIFDLSGIKLENVDIIYLDEQNNNTYSAFFKNTSAAFKLKDEDWEIDLKGDIHTHTVKINQWEFFKDKPVSLESKIIYSEKEKVYKITPSKIHVLNAFFNVEGEFRDTEKPGIDFKFSEQNSDFQTIISFLPPKFSEPLAAYRSKGNIYFKGFVKGDISRGKKPWVKVEFGCKNASFYHPDIKEGISKASFTGEFNNRANERGRHSLFSLINIKADLNGKTLAGNFTLDNFNDPYIEMDAHSSIDAAYFFKVFPSEKVEKASGEFDFNISFKGKTADLKKRDYASLNTSGEITLKNLDLKLKTNRLELKSCTGSFIFNKTDLSANNFSCRLGQSDIRFTGILENIIPYILYKNEPLTIDANVKSDFINMDELLTMHNHEETQTTAGDTHHEQPYSFVMPLNIGLLLDCNVKKLKFKRFNAANIEGKLSLSAGELTGKEIKMEIAQGKLSLDGRLKQKKDTTFEAETAFKFDKIQIDSIFYMTDNFGQDFVTNKILKGQLTAETKAFFVFDKHLSIKEKSLLVQSDMSIKNGQLVNFGPMKNLSKFVREDALTNIKFSELKNTIQIADKTVFIPEMEIKSNITKMSVMGSHTFNNEFEYRLKIPLRNYKKKGNLEEENAIEGNIFTGFYLYLIIKGTPDNFKISYDAASVKQKIKERWQEEKKEFTDLFKKDFQKKQIEKQKAKEVNDDEFFDF